MTTKELKVKCKYCKEKIDKEFIKQHEAEACDERPEVQKQKKKIIKKEERMKKKKMKEKIEKEIVRENKEEQKKLF